MQKYYDLVEDADDNQAEPSATDKQILDFLASKTYKDFAQVMSDDGEVYTELKCWAEEQLDLPMHDGLFLGHAIQAIVNDKFNDLPIAKQAWMRRHPDNGWIEMEPTDENIKLVAHYIGDSEKYVRELLDMDHRLVSKRSEIDGEMMYGTDLKEEVI